MKILAGHPRWDEIPNLHTYLHLFEKYPQEILLNSTGQTFPKTICSALSVLRIPDVYPGSRIQGQKDSGSESA
jgi:hypothetical protein